MKKFNSLVISVLLLAGINCNAVDENRPGAAAIASTNTLATRAGMEIIRSGGNAFDAAVAISAVLAVTEPYDSSLGGGGLWLIYRASDGKQVMIDGRERAPELAHNNLFLDDGGNVLRGSSINGPLAAAIPGLPAGIVHLSSNYGKLPLKDSLAPAIRLAEKGYRINERYRDFATTRKYVLNTYTAAADIFLDHGEVPEVGHKLVQKDLARTLMLLAGKGRDGFYRGENAEKMVVEVNKYGGVWTAGDLSGYQALERIPIVITYHDMKVISAPPPSAGGIVLGQALKILAGFNLKSMGNIGRKHYVIEAMRLAYRDRPVYLGDPDFVDIPVARLLNDDYLEGLALTVVPDKATPSYLIGDTPNVAQAGSQTTHFSVIDFEGNRVAATLSINTMFGSGFVPSGTGVLLNNNMDDFFIKNYSDDKPDTPDNMVNAIQPGKRPLSSMTPTFLETNDRIAILGTPGGSWITSMILLAALDFADGGNPGSWVRVPRYHHQYLPDVVMFERDGLSFEEQRELHEMGYRLQEHRSVYGDMQAVMWDRKTGRVFAASDPRGDGSAVVISE